MLRVGVIGVGRMGKNHVRIYSEMDDVELVCVSDVSQKVGKEIADSYGVNFYSSYEKMIQVENLDLVSIVVPTDLHYEVSMFVIKNGVNCLIEKPISYKYEEGLKIKELAKEKNVLVNVGHVERFNPAILKLKEIILNGDLGKLVMLSSSRMGIVSEKDRNDNVLVDLAVHDIDLMRFLSDSNVNNAFSICKKVYGTHVDAAQIILEFKDKIIGNIHVNWVAPIKIRRFEVIGTKGFANVELITQDLKIYRRPASLDYTDFHDFLERHQKNLIEEKVEVEKNEPLFLELRSFVDQVLGKKKSFVSIDDGIAAIRVVDIALRKQLFF